MFNNRYFVAAEMLRRRMFANFALAAAMPFDAEVCSGARRLNPTFPARDADPGPPIRKRHVIRRPCDAIAELPPAE